MTYTLLRDFGNDTAGLHVLFLYVADIVPIFIPMVLFSFFVILLLGSYMVQRRLTNRGDFVSSFAAAGYATTILAVIFSLIPNLINLTTLIVTILVAILGTFWLMFSKQN